MKAVIMAGGQGTRLRSISGDLPKPMVPVCGKPILQYQIENLKENGIEDIILVTGYLGEAVKAHFGDGSRFGVRISYFTEERPLGTAGALYYLKEQLSEAFLLLMGDLMLNVDFTRFMRFHKETGGLASLFVHPNSHPYDSDIIVTDTVGTAGEFSERRCGENAFLRSGTGLRADGREAGSEVAAHAHARVTGVLGKKEERNGYYHNQVNAGLYALSAGALSGLREPKEAKIDLDKDVIRPLIAEEKVYAYRSTEYVKDMGTPDRYASVSHDLKQGIVSSRNLSNKQKCIFLDRDGTINELNGFVKCPEEFTLLPGAAEAIGKINRSEYLCIVVTNQPVIARGECSFAQLDEIHAKLETTLGQAGVYIDALYFCPHHTDKGFAGEIAELKFDCACRKPKTGLIEQAAREYNIDLSASYLIGDMTQDIACGKRAGLKTVLVKTGMGGSDGKYGDTPDMICKTLSEAAERIVGGSGRSKNIDDH